jgi:hypothetical protein
MWCLYFAKTFIYFFFFDKLTPFRLLSARRVHLGAPAKVFSTGILKISVVTDKREYRIYWKFIDDKNKILKEI